GPASPRHRPDARAVSGLPAAAGPTAPGPPAAGQARPVGRGPADPVAGPSGARPVPGPLRRRVGGLAAADPGPQPGPGRARFRPRPARPGPRAVPGGGPGRIVAPPASL